MLDQQPVLHMYFISLSRVCPCQHKHRLSPCHSLSIYLPRCVGNTPCTIGSRGPYTGNCMYGLGGATPTETNWACYSGYTTTGQVAYVLNTGVGVVPLAPSQDIYTGYADHIQWGGWSLRHTPSLPAYMDMHPLIQRMHEGNIQPNHNFPPTLGCVL